MNKVIRFPLERASWPKDQRGCDEQILRIIRAAPPFAPELVEEFMRRTEEYLCRLSSKKDPAPDRG